MDAAEDELFKLTTKGGKLVVETETVTTDTSDFDAGLIFEQDPVQIIDALLPLYLNSTLLRSLQARARAQASLFSVTLVMFPWHPPLLRSLQARGRAHASHSLGLPKVAWAPACAIWAVAHGARHAAAKNKQQPLGWRCGCWPGNHME